MAGHSKWANIKRHKAKVDAKRGKLYTKLIREITVSAKLGGADPDQNPRLRTAVDKALGANMSRDVIDRAAKRGAGGMEGEIVEEVTGRSRKGAIRSDRCEVEFPGTVDANDPPQGLVPFVL